MFTIWQLGFLFGGAGTLIGIIIYTLRSFKEAGRTEQRSDDITLAVHAEDEIHKIQAQQRETPETKKRLDDGSF